VNRFSPGPAGARNPERAPVDGRAFSLAQIAKSKPCSPPKLRLIRLLRTP
jgi:hypothetical protein